MKGGEGMPYQLEFVLKFKHVPISEILEVVGQIKKVHPDAKFTVEVEE